MRSALPLLPALACALPLAAQELAPDRERGLSLRLFQLGLPVEVLPELVPNQTPNVDRRVATLDLAGDDFAGVEAPHLSQALGWLVVDVPGEHRLRLTSDDGSRLFLDGALVIDNDGRHGMGAVESAPLRLEAGEHALLVEHFDSGGARGLRLEWLSPGAEGFELVPESALVCDADPTRVTSPGAKQIVDDRRPGLGLPLEGAHPGWRVEGLRPEGFEAMVGSLCFLPDGRLAFGTFDPLQRDEESLPDIESKSPDTIWALDLATREVEPIATDVYEPSGLCVVDGELYVAHRRAVERLVDTDGDGFLETHELVADGWEGWNYHQFSFGLAHRAGKLYTALSTSMAPPDWEGMGTNAGPNGPLRGSVLEIDLETGSVSAIAGGTRTPNGIGFWRGRLLYTDNQGAWYPASALHEVLPGRFFGHFNRTNFVPKLAERFPHGGHGSIYSDRPRAAPVVWLPHGEASNSPTTPLEIRDGPFAGQLLIGELTAGGVRRAFLEEVDGTLQGAVFRFTQGLESGVNRMAWGPDGALYVGGIGAGGNWNWQGTRYGLERLVPTGETAFEPLAVSATREGFRLRFTRTLDAARATDPANYSVESWTYAPTADYGGPKVDTREHRVTSATLTDRDTGVDLAVDGLRAGSVVHLTFDVLSVDGERPWTAEAWYTLERIPSVRETWASTSPVETEGPGWVWLAAGGVGATLAEVERPSNLDAVSVLEREAFVLAPGGEGVRTRTLFADAVLEFELRAAEGPGDPAPLELRAGQQGLFLEGASTDLEWTRHRVLLESRSRDSHFHVERGVGVDQGFQSISEVSFLPSDGPSPIEFRAGGGVGDRALELRRVRVHDAEPAAPGQAGEWLDLLDDASRFVVRGGDARFELVDGVLRGETRPNTPNTFFVTREEYADFELLFEVRIDEALNSGVQLRSEVAGGLDNRSGGMVGYQCEIDPGDRAWSGGVYEERGRGWLHPLHSNPAARRAWRGGEWNRFRVVCAGPVLRTWVNGVPAAELFDDVRAEGHIGFQVHGVGGREGPLRVEWRRVRLRRLR